jgi:hypothetical protein
MVASSRHHSAIVSREIRPHRAWQRYTYIHSRNTHTDVYFWTKDESVLTRGRGGIGKGGLGKHGWPAARPTRTHDRRPRRFQPNLQPKIRYCTNRLLISRKPPILCLAATCLESPSGPSGNEENPPLPLPPGDTPF